MYGRCIATSRLFDWNWLDLHLYLHLVATILTAIGLFVPFAIMLDDEHVHFTSWHSWIGVVAAVFTSFIQPLSGLPDETATRAEKKFMYMMHGFLGRAVIWLSAGVLLLGGNLLEYASAVSDYDLSTFWSEYSFAFWLKAWVACVFVPIIACDLYSTSRKYSGARRVKSKGA
jgi:hypothetical protein